MMLRLLNMYAMLFARPRFRGFNTFVLLMGMRGLGIFNWRDMHLSGEIGFLEKAFMLIEREGGGIALDIGANHGDYSQHILKFADNVNIYAFEPHPLTFRQLKSNMAQYGERARLFNTALGNSTGMAVIYDCEDEDGSPYASFYKQAIEEIRERRAISHDVQIDRLDQLLSPDEIAKVIFIKIDTEGAERDVLLGAKSALDSPSLKFIQIEFNEMNASSSTFLWEIMECIPSCYSPYRLLPGGKMLSLTPHVIWQNEIFGFQNIVFIHKDYQKYFST